MTRRWMPAVLEGHAMASFAMTESEAGSDVAAIADHCTIRRRRLCPERRQDLHLERWARRLLHGLRFDRPRPWQQGHLLLRRPRRCPGVSLRAPSRPVGATPARRDRVRGMSHVRRRTDSAPMATGSSSAWRRSIACAPPSAPPRAGWPSARLSEALQHARARRQFGRPLAKFQLVQEKLARMATDLTAARLLVYRAAWEKDRGAERVTLEAAMAKAFATEAAQHIVDDAVQILGGRGVLADHPVDRLYRSVRALRIYEGTTEIQHLVIAGQLLEMRIVSIGGGPAGLYFAILMKKADPAHDVLVLERNRPDDTFGFGVVFSDATLENLAEADPETLRRDRPGASPTGTTSTSTTAATCISSTGHGFAGLSRRALLEILARRCAELGRRPRVRGRGARTSTSYRDADLILAADGVNSVVRERFAEHFRPTHRLASQPLRLARHDPPVPGVHLLLQGRPSTVLWRVHAYQYEREHPTFIVEATRRRRGAAAGLDARDRGRDDRVLRGALRRGAPRASAAAEPLDLAQLPARSGTSAGTTGNVVLLGDAAHTAHFSVGSGTKLAMEDAIALARALGQHADVPEAAGRLRGGATARGREPAARGPGEPRMVREHRALHAARADAVRLQPADAQPAHHARQPEGARSAVRGRRGSLVCAARPHAGADGGATRSPATAAVHALPAARAAAREPRRRVADVPVLGRGRHPERLAPGPPREPGDRRRGARDRPR